VIEEVHADSAMILRMVIVAREVATEVFATLSREVNVTEAVHANSVMTPAVAKEVVRAEATEVADPAVEEITNAMHSPEVSAPLVIHANSATTPTAPMVTFPERSLVFAMHSKEENAIAETLADSSTIRRAALPIHFAMHSKKENAPMVTIADFLTTLAVLVVRATADLKEFAMPFKRASALMVTRVDSPTSKSNIPILFYQYH